MPTLQKNRARLFAVLLLVLTNGAAPVHAATGGLLLDFETGHPPWKINQAGITVESSPETEQGQGCLKITIAKTLNWRMGAAASLETVRLGILSGPYLPPEADAIRMRIRAISGRAILAVGGPVSQIGNSDVFCDPQQVVPGESNAWRTVEFSLNHRLARNFRRPNFSGDLPIVYYTRWVQEPVYLHLVAPPEGPPPDEDTVFFVDQVEWVSRGEGKPFPKFDEAQIERLGTIADFESDQDLTNVFSVAHGYSFITSFVVGYRRTPGLNDTPLPDYVRKASPFVAQEGLRYPVPRYRRVEAPEGRSALRAEGTWAEEAQIITIKTRGAAGANALALTLRPNFPSASSAYAFRHEGKPAHAVDVVVWVSPTGDDFPWSDLEATDELKQAFRKRGEQGPGSKFDYLIATEKVLPIRAGTMVRAGPFGFYVARRYLTAGDWSTLIIPMADFICVYGQGAVREKQVRQAALTPEQIAAVGLCMPYGSGHGTLDVDSVDYVRVPGEPDALRSFWQVPDVSSVRLVPLPRFNRYRSWSLMTSGEDAPDFLK